MNAQVCGMPPRRAAPLSPKNCPPSCFFRTLTQTPTQACAQVAVGPDHCTSLHGDLTTGSASSGPRQAQLNVSGPDHSRTTCHCREGGPAIDRPCRYRVCVCSR